ncbi:MAG: hypothetical protein IKV16_00740 [Clostridia bacterium]|nr:hypothetical protein [Clostridia bacterium]
MRCSFSNYNYRVLISRKYNLFDTSSTAERSPFPRWGRLRLEDSRCDSVTLCLSAASLPTGDGIGDAVYDGFHATLRVDSIPQRVADSIHSHSE